MRFFRSLLKDRSGATAVEYGVLAAILAVTLAIALGNYYELMNGVFSGLGGTYQNATSR
ncbi:Flp family type IVb pilin [Aliirhizobium terrae]|uniref:Flp family type IVb pilin n=1 Tax=Terrirhizobium terrae TaxID=2926709 RepID=UPI00257868EF|nr:Flp family type IVb pilin [Rhizobium sp. CC-CFT758]WJH41224.1 Flp family type IVb pilin [Rhizobium sp. CC-CFT758]